MIKNIRHTGIVVNDLEKMAVFYRQLGFIEVSREIESGQFIEKVVNIPKVELEWIKMRSPDGYLIELLQYLSHPQKLSRDKAKSNDLSIATTRHFISSLSQITFNLLPQFSTT